MRSRAALVTAVILGALLGGWWVSRVRAEGPAKSAPTAERDGIELTVYAQDFGLVREVRPLSLAKGPNRLRLAEVSREMDPHSVLLRWREGERNSPQLVAHAYDLGVGSGTGLLQRYLGREVEVVRYGENGREAERQSGRLMVQGAGEVVVQTDGKFYVNPHGTVVAPAAEVVTLPQLTLQAESPAAQAARLELAYLTRGLSWSADYVATLAPKGETAALECWAAVTNRTGVDYPNAKVSLIAGAPNRAVVEARSRRLEESEHLNASADFRRGGMPRLAAAAGRAFESPQAAGDFHAYPVAAPTTVAQEQMNRLLMLSRARLPVRREYSVRLPDLSPWYLYEWGTSGSPRRDGASVTVTFRNDAKTGLGLPLPRGSVRVYEPDRSGSLRYAGAATLPDTPKNRPVRLTLARAFDLSIESRITKKARVKKRTTRYFVEAVPRNEKAVPAELRIVQGFPGRWRMAGESHPHVNLDANTIQWRLAVPAAGTATLRYAVDVTE